MAKGRGKRRMGSQLGGTWNVFEVRVHSLSKPLEVVDSHLCKRVWCHLCLETLNLSKFHRLKCNAREMPTLTPRKFLLSLQKMLLHFDKGPRECSGLMCSSFSYKCLLCPGS